MKALTLTQPWATLVAIGAKRIETRSWRTNYRGLLAIHAAAGWNASDREFVRTELVQTAFAGRVPLPRDPDALPRGVVIATCQLVDCVPTDDLDLDLGEERAFRRIGGYENGEDLYCWCSERDYGGRAWELDEREIAFGNFTPGRFAWLLDDPVELYEHVPAKGKLMLWDWEYPR